jgi:hypothetical protein
VGVFELRNGHGSQCMPVTCRLTRSFVSRQPIGLTLVCLTAPLARITRTEILEMPDHMRLAPPHRDRQDVTFSLRPK